MADTTFVAVVNDTNPDNGGRSYNLTVSGNNLSQFLGKKIGDSVDGIFVGDGEVTLGGFKLEITGGSDLTGTPMRADLDGGGRKKILVSPSTGFKGHKIVKKKGGRYRYTYDGLRKRRAFRGNVISSDTRQINLKIVESGNKSLADIFSSGSDGDAGEGDGAE